MASGAPTFFDAPAGIDAGALAALVAERLGAVLETPSRERRTALDTFDWRVHRGGFALEHVAMPDGSRLVLRPWGATTTLVSVPVGPTPPASAGELPAGRLRDRVAPLLDVRALTPAATSEVVVHTAVLRNGDEKAVARVVVDDLGAGRVQVRCLGIRGYDRFRDHAAALLETVGCSPHPDDPIADAVALTGRTVGDRGGRLALDLDASGSAAAGWVSVLRVLLGEVEANVPGALSDQDTEFLHDLRVAVRRSRSALRHARAVLPDELLACFRPELREVQAMTGPARDMDVYVLGADTDFALLPARGVALEPFRAFLGQRRAAAHDDLVAYLRSSSFDAVLADWRHTLDSLAGSLDDPEAGEWGPWPVSAHETLRHVAAARIRSQHERLLRDGKAIDDASRPETLHDLRKRAKELRYLLELFGDTVDAPRSTVLVKALKGLQDVLGEFQDTEVQVGALRGWADEMAGTRSVPAATLLAMGELVERLQQRQLGARAAFAERFGRFAAAGRP